MKNKVFLIGFMGSGKSSCGRSIADKLDWKFTDLDKLIETEYGQSVHDIFIDEGEKFFREVEAKILLSMADYDKTVIALGGGACCNKKAIDFITKQGCVVYLRLSPEALFNRLSADKKKRPLLGNLEGKKLFDFIEKTLSLRIPFYERAHITSDVEHEELKDLVMRIRAYLR